MEKKLANMAVNESTIYLSLSGHLHINKVFQKDCKTLKRFESDKEGSGIL